jgi:hypothetical protein
LTISVNAGAGAGSRKSTLEERKGGGGGEVERDSFIRNYPIRGFLGRHPLEEEDFAALESVGQVIPILSKVNLSKTSDYH